MRKQGQVLIDRVATLRPQLVEQTDGSKRIVARGEFARAGVPTENGRVYPKELWLRESGRLREAIQARRVFGELDHPADGRTQLSRASHLLTGLELEGDVLVGEAEVMDTAKGKDLLAIMRSGGAVGVSSRGYGTTSPDGEGNEVVQEDYRLMTFDFVAEPANTTSYPEVHSESKSSPVAEEEGMDLTKLTLEGLKSGNPALYESIVAAAKAEAEAAVRAAKEQMQESLVHTLSEVKAKALEEARAEVASDPSSSKKVLEQVRRVLGVRIAEGEEGEGGEGEDDEAEKAKEEAREARLRIAGLEEQLEKLMGVAKRAAYEVHLHRKLRGEARAEALASLVGDVRQYESVKAMDSKLEAVKAELEKAAKVEAVERGRVRALEEENAKLRKSLAGTLRVTRGIAVDSYVQQKVRGHPKAKALSEAIAARGPKNVDDVDRLYEAFAGRLHSRSGDEAERIRKKLARGREALAESAEPARKSSGPLAEELAEVGGDLRNILALSGVGG